MTILYPSEHITCFNYDNGDRPVIEIKKISKDAIWEIEPLENKILFVTKGLFNFSYGKYVDEQLTEGQMILVPSGFTFKASILEDVSLLIVRLRTNVELCERFTIEQLNPQNPNSDDGPAISLTIIKTMHIFLDGLEAYIVDGLKCFYLFEMKVKELLFILRAYYTKEELSGFFHPLLSYDTSFSNLIISNYTKVRSIKELADLTHYSLSGFEKHFKKVFGVSASQWMKIQKSKLIYHDINDRDKTFKEISFIHGFYSPAHFNDFCKSQFGYTPGEIRKQKLHQGELQYASPEEIEE